MKGDNTINADTDYQSDAMEEIVIDPSDRGSASPVIVISLIIGGVAVTIIIIAAYNIVIYGNNRHMKRPRKRR